MNNWQQNKQDKNRDKRNIFLMKVFFYFCIFLEAKSMSASFPSVTRRRVSVSISIKFNVWKQASRGD